MEHSKLFISLYNIEAVKYVNKVKFYIVASLT